MNKIISIITILVFITYFGCGENVKDEGDKQSTGEVNKDQKEGDGDCDNFVEGMKNFKDMMEKGEKVETVDFRKLKEMLPPGLENMKRKSATGEKTNAFGINVSQAEAEYESEDGQQRIIITITDLGSMKGFASMAAFGWAFAEVDKETDNSYERTRKFKGYKAFEQYNTEYRDGTLEVLVGERFMVKGEGWDVDMEAVLAAVGSVDLDELAGMKDIGVKE